MGAKDFKINSDVRRILIKNWIDLKKLRYCTIGGVVCLRGELDTMYNAPGRDEGRGGIRAEQVSDLERALRKVTNVNRIKFTLNNWEKGSEGWSRKIQDGTVRPESTMP